MVKLIWTNEMNSRDKLEVTTHLCSLYCGNKEKFALFRLQGQGKVEVPLRSGLVKLSEFIKVT